MFFKDDDLKRMREDHSSVNGRYETTFMAFVRHNFTSVAAKEHAHHGYARRLKTLQQCINNVYNILPPDFDSLPDTALVADVQINVQAFLFNIFGSIDNLAWIFMHEKSITQPSGRPVPPSLVSLFKDGIIRDELSGHMREYIKSIESWYFDYVENYRHALAHRIPLYIPPYAILQKNQKYYDALEAEKSRALMAMDFVLYDKLDAEQSALGVFQPLIMHSYADKVHPIVFHPQMLSDFITVTDLGQQLLVELG